MVKRLIEAAIKVILWIAGVGAGILLLTITVLMIAEYHPAASEEPEIIRDDVSKTVREGDRIEIMTFNVGYAGLDGAMDSFLDGGVMNTPESKGRIVENLTGQLELIGGRSYDVLFLQEVDRDSKRSYAIDESEVFGEQLGGTSIFAQNHRCLYVPYPLLDPVGRVNSGMQTLTALSVRSAERIALPTSYQWPVRTCQPKRCLLVARIPVVDSGRELVLINVHMDAWEKEADSNGQMMALAEFMQAEYDVGNYVIAGGDFNQAFPDDNLSVYPMRDRDFFEPARLEREMLRGEWTFASDISSPTKRRLDAPYSRTRWWSQYYVLDGFILSPNVRLEEVTTLDEEFEFSDHNPVWMAVTLG